MDFLDSLLNSSPKEKFLQCLQNANLGALDIVCDDFIKEYIAMMEILEQNGKTIKDIKNHIISSNDELDSKMNDFYIDFVAKVYSKE